MRMVKLGEIATVERRGVQPDQFPANTVYLGLEHIEKGGRILEYAAAIESGLRSTKFQFTSDHLLYGKLRPYLAKIALPDREGICSTDILPVLPGPELDRTYLAYYLRQGSLVDFAASRASGANLPRLSARQLEQLPVPVPPLDEQRRIAAILDKADAIRTKRRQVLAHLELAPFAAIESLLRDGVWDSRPLADLAEVWDCAHSTPVWTDSGKTCLRTSNLGRGFWDWTDTRYVSLDDFQIRQKGGGALPGDIILSREGTVGIGAMVQPGMTVAMGQRLVQVRAKSIEEHFLLWYLLYALDPIRISHVMVGATSKHLNVKDLRAMSIPTPGSDVQKQFANFATRLVSEQEMVLQAIAQDDALFASLQSRAFKGEL